MAELRPIVIAIDGSEESKTALRMGCRVAKGMGSPVVLVAVVPPPTVYPGGMGPVIVEPLEVERSYRAVLIKGEEVAKEEGVTRVRSELLQGVVVDSLVEYLRHTNALMGVLGARGLSGAARLFLGSVSDAVVHHAPCPILIVRTPPPAS